MKDTNEAKPILIDTCIIFKLIYAREIFNKSGRVGVEKSIQELKDKYFEKQQQLVDILSKYTDMDFVFSQKLSLVEIESKIETIKEKFGRQISISGIANCASQILHPIESIPEPRKSEKILRDKQKLKKSLIEYEECHEDYKKFVEIKEEMKAARMHAEGYKFFLECMDGIYKPYVSSTAFLEAKNHTEFAQIVDVPFKKVEKQTKGEDRPLTDSEKRRIKYNGFINDDEAILLDLLEENSELVNICSLDAETKKAFNFAFEQIKNKMHFVRKTSADCKKFKYETLLSLFGCDGICNLLTYSEKEAKKIAILSRAYRNQSQIVNDEGHNDLCGLMPMSNDINSLGMYGDSTIMAESTMFNLVLITQNEKDFIFVKNADGTINNIKKAQYIEVINKILGFNEKCRAYSLNELKNLDNEQINVA